MTYDNDPYRLYTRDETAEWLRINQAYLTELCNTGQLQSIRLGRRRLFTRAAIEAFIRGEREVRFDTPDVETGTGSLFPREADTDTETRRADGQA